MARTMPRAARLLGVLAMAPLLILITTGMLTLTSRTTSGASFFQGYCGIFGCAPARPPDEALERPMPSFPPKSPREAAVWRAGELNRRAEVLISRHQYRQAERPLKEAIRIYRNAVSRENEKELAPLILRNLALVYKETDRNVEANATIAEAGVITQRITQRYCYWPGSNDMAELQASQCETYAIEMPRDKYRKWRESRENFNTEFVGREYCYRPRTNHMNELRGPECAADAYQMSSSDYLEWRVSKTSFKLEFERTQRTTSAK